VRIQFLGATRQVTGSRFCLDTGKDKILIDCGMFQERAFRNRNWDPFPIPPSELSAVILTHAHVDHCGLLPRLVNRGFQGRIYMTPPSADLVEIVLKDSAYIQMEDLKYKLKRHRREGRDGPHDYEPLYDDRDVEKTIPLLEPVDFGKPHRITSDVSVSFIEAGHILGAASLRLEVKRDHGGVNTVVFSGDIGQWNKPLIRDPETFAQADYLIMESTYGNRLHELDKDVESQLREVLVRTAERRGKLVIPTFAIERAQELMYYFGRIMARGGVPAMPYFLDSPMAVDVTEIFRRYQSMFDQDAIDLINSGTAPLRFPGLTMSRSADESKAINETKGPAVIMSTSGMCDAGRIKHHLRRWIEDANSTILFVGYQSEGTLGRLILDGRPEVRIHGRQYKVRAERAQIYGFSGHADRNGLLKWCGELKTPPRQTFLVHGEEQSALDLAKTIGDLGWSVTVPRYQEVTVLE
jgi:metallo-beta-lactamase family protein